MAIEATNYDGTKDYSVAEIKDVYHPNLLINGDFKINQRGQTIYTSIATAASLTVDCWRIGGQATLTVNDDNIILSATGSGEAYLAQHIDKDLTGEKLSVAVKVKYDKVYTGTITVTDVETVFISDGQWMTVSAKYDSNRKGTQIYINVKGGHSYSFKYADAFEGSIVYPHIEEDDATALMRCEKKLLKLPNGFSAYTDDRGTEIYFTNPKLMIMDEIPTLISSVTGITLKVNGNTVIAKDIQSINPNITTSEFTIHLSSSYSSLQSITANGYFNNNVNLLFSCEAL